MSDFLKALGNFLRSVYSEADGTGSSSRILTTVLAAVASGILWKVFNHLIQLSDVALLTAWLASLPLLIAALIAFFTSPYGVNKASGSFTDVLNSLRGKQPPQQ